MRKKILIVEDNDESREMLHEILIDEFDIIEATNGKEAIDIIEEMHLGLSAVILDLVMPVMSGKELLKKIVNNSRYINLPILVNTGEHNCQTEVECFQLGAWDYVTKPYNSIIIKMRLKNIIARSESTLLEQIQELSQRDYLTGLYNRRYFMQQTSKMLNSNSNDKYVFIRVSIDNFRIINSYFGKDERDTFLKNIASQIIPCLIDGIDKECTYGRIEADIFCLCIPYDECSLLDSIKKADEKIQLLGLQYRIHIMFGLYVIRNNNEDVEQIFNKALVAILSCKSDYSIHYSFYNSEMSIAQRKEHRMITDLDNAIQERQFEVYLQPQYSVKSDKVCGAEALARWKHPELGMISPGDFIPAFENNGLIINLDVYMWESVCIILRRWIDEGEKIYPISVNLSRISLYNINIVQTLYGISKKYNIPANMLHIEITESAYMSNPHLMKDVISKFHDLGFVILMDDFGSGYSSLNTLKNIDMDILKVDMKFLPTGHDNLKSEKILASVLRMAGWLGMPVVVEGVETEIQRDFLDSIGCNYIQGYLYSKPITVTEFEKLVAHQNASDSEKKKKTKAKTRLSKNVLESFDDIWASDSRTGTILKTLAVPFAIIEYGNSKVDILRENEVYKKEFNNSSIDELLNCKERTKFINKIEEVILSHENGECVIMFTYEDDNISYKRIKLIYIGTVEKTSLLSITLTDVTAQQKMEIEINRLVRSMKEDKNQKTSMLIVDDVRICREILKSIFEDSYNIILAANGKEALELLRNNSDTVEAILLDMIMPEMNGYEFLLNKNKMPEAEDIPVIVISSETSQDTQINMLENGVNDYIEKPFVSAIVKRRVRNVIEYNSRFRHLVKEYNEISKLCSLEKNE